MNQMPPKRRGDAREKILELAESAVLAKGFTATSIDELVAGAGITKSGFFYHFKDKNALAKAMILRYLERDQTLLDDLFRRADELNEDPLMADLPDNYPGCLAASFCYQDQLFDAEIRDLNAQGMLEWRQRFRARFEAIAGRYPPREPVDMEALADMTTVLVEGGLILGRALQDSSILPRQILMFRDYVRLVFAPG